MAKRIIAAAGVTLDDLTEYEQGETVELGADDEAKLEASRALVPQGFDSFDEWSSYLQDAYRGGRGDLTAAGRLQESRSGAVTQVLDGPPSAATYSAWLREESPNVDETVAQVEGDPEKAAFMLEAEAEASGGSPRAGVEKALTAIIEKG